MIHIHSDVAISRPSEPEAISPRAGLSAPDCSKMISSDASPLKSALEDLIFLRQTFRETLYSYGNRIEAEIAHICEAISAEARNKKIPIDHLHDVRDMITLMRTLETKPVNGRRRDLKKFELVVVELSRFVDKW